MVIIYRGVALSLVNAKLPLFAPRHPSALATWRDTLEARSARGRDHARMARARAECYCATACREA